MDHGATYVRYAFASERAGIKKFSYQLYHFPYSKALYTAFKQYCYLLLYNVNPQDKLFARVSRPAWPKPERIDTPQHNKLKTSMRFTKLSLPS